MYKLLEDFIQVLNLTYGKIVIVKTGHFLFHLLIPFLLGIDFGWAQSSDPEGFPFIETYQRGQFVGARQTYGIIRADDGLLYFGNTRYGIQESDGLSWRNLWMERNSAALSFAKHPDGRIFVGGQADFGVLQRDSLLRRSYSSLAYLLPDSATNIKDVEFTFVLEDEVHFVSSEVWYVYSDGEIAVQMNRVSISSAAFWDNSIITLQLDGQIMRTINGSASAISHPNKNSKAIKLSAAKDRLFMLDDEFTIWELNKSYTWSKVLKLSKEISEASVIIKDFLWSQAGYIHVATSNGLFTFKQEGEYIHTIYDSDGLCDNDLGRLYEDEALNIWVSSMFGVSVLEYGRAMREFLPSAHNLPEYSATLKNFNGSLYVGGNTGLFVWEKGKFRQLYDDKSVYVFELTAYGLLIGTSKGMQLLDKKGTFHTVFPEGRIDLILADRDNPNVIYYSHDTHAVRKVVLESESKYIDSKLVDFGVGGYTITEDVNGDLWIGTGRNGNFQFEAIQKENVIVSISEVKQFTTDHGLPSNGFNYTMSVGQDVGFITSDGFYRLTSDRDSIIIDHRFDEVFSGQDRSVWPVVQDNNGGIWLAWAASHIGKAVYNPEKDTFEWNDGEFTRTEPYWDIDFIYPALRNRIYFQTFTQKLAYYDSTLYIQPVPTINAHITSVIINSDSLLLEPRGIPDPVLEAPIQFRDNKIRINYGMIAFLPEDRLFYQIKLEGLDDEWSGTTNERYRDYTNLREGEYTFWVRGLTLYPEESELASFSFVVLPPWYRTWWAYTLYTLFGLGCVLTFVKIRERHLLERQQELEQEILNRTEKIRTQNEQLEKLDKVKSTFFSNVSHEFRTPLTLIKGPTEELLKNTSLSPSQKIVEYERILKNCDRLLLLIEQILSLSKMESGTFKLEIQQIDIVDLLRRVSNWYLELARRKNLEYEVQLPDTEIRVFADVKQIELLFSNVISNAVKYTDKGKVMIQCFSKEKEVIISVQDTGVGISLEEHGKVFDRYFRGRTGMLNASGSGIGLNLVKHVAELHGIDISLESEEGRGSQFIFTYPLSLEKIQSEYVLLAEDDFLSFATQPNAIPKGESHSERNRIQFFENNPELDIPLIMIADDNPDIRQFIIEVLGDDFRYWECSNGQELIDDAEEVQPDIILSDVMMPGVDGISASKILKVRDSTAHIPVIMLTAKGGQHNELVGLQSGANDYMYKPFSPEILKARVNGQISLLMRLRIFYSSQLKEIKPNEDNGSTPPVEREDRSSMVGDQSIEIKKVIEIAEFNFFNPDFSVEDWAQKAYMSRSTLYRLLKTEYSMSPVEYLKRSRLLMAQKMLQKKEGTVGEVAYAVGFSSVSYFSRIFQQEFGIKASELAR